MAAADVQRVYLLDNSHRHVLICAKALNKLRWLTVNLARAAIKPGKKKILLCLT